ncbi:glycosyltransferase [Chitinophaga flava]|uniref:Amylovoran biosynthesis protein AmsE n=1 Tax=Chitinophaga flava TaxID=2259036 RepID=A0A365Y647_9BACT|nr:glycosyltransferase [Chitinophaga flava]RBL93808.1 amylovoran biosynthesis protein AmsE [Chitinophaga flava]
MSVYFKENPGFLRASLESIFNQSHMPDEVVLVKDGPLTPELDVVIEEYRKRWVDGFHIVPLEKNVGLGRALQIGIMHCQYDYIARMDSDDICYLDRFEKQVLFIAQNRNISVLGTGIMEFNEQPNDMSSVKILPSSNAELVKYAGKRCPFNHSSVMLNKAAIIAAGSYQEMPFLEDYYLWLRVMKKGYEFANLPEPLLYFRIGNDVIGRRQGWGYARNEMNLFWRGYKEQLISTGNFLYATFFRLPLRLLPKKALSFIYHRLLRQQTA